MWDEVIWEFKKMWETRDYSFDGKYFQVPGAQHPAQALRWRPHAPADVGGGRQPSDLREGRPPRPRRAGLQRRDGPCHEGPGGRLQGRHQGRHARRPVRQRQRDDQQHDAVPGGRPPGPAGPRRQHVSYFFSLLYLYHDTFPVPEGAVRWPDPSTRARPRRRRADDRVRDDPLRGSATRFASNSKPSSTSASISWYSGAPTASRSTFSASRSSCSPRR